MKLKRSTSIRRHLTFITLTFSLLLAVFFSSICIFLFRTVYEDNMEQSAAFNLQLISDNIAHQMENTDFLSRWCAGSGLIAEYFEKNEPDQEVILEIRRRLMAEYNTNSSSAYIRRLVLMGLPGSDTYSVQLLHSQRDSVSSPEKKIAEYEVFQKFSASEDNYMLTYTKTPFCREGEAVLLSLRPIYSENSLQKIGYVYMELYPDIITDYFENYTFSENTRLYLTMEDQSYRLTGDSITAETATFPENQKVISCDIGFRSWKLQQNLVQKFPFYTAAAYWILAACAVFALFLFGICFSLYLNRKISRPILRLRQRILAISAGNFQTDPFIEWDTELGDIGRGINQMSADMQKLMDQAVADEKAKADLQYKMLLNQVNPHFIYNTLNSIKWMATIQGASGIADMTTSLARLLKNVSKRTETLISFQEEYRLLDDYFNIMQYRYGGGITLEYEIEDERLEDGLIPRFTLQPLVENAIFHGIEPRHSKGSIRISARFLDENRWQIKLLDDGIGMTPEQIQAALTQDNGSADGLFRSVGIYSVNQRIRYEFGDSYGLSIESCPGSYTAMYLTLPYHTDKKEEENDPTADC